MRHPDDAYLTPQPLANAIALALARYIPAPQSILEPSAGEGAFVNAAQLAWPSARIQAVEPRYEASSRLKVPTYHGVLEMYVQGPDAFRQFDLALGNPPYVRAEAHVALCRTQARTVAFLLRMSFLGSRRRASTLWNKPGLMYLMPLAQRPSFTGGGTDTSEYAVFVWERGFDGRPTILPHLWVTE